MDKIIESLKEIGFNTYEAKVYLALLKKHPTTGYEISKLADMPQSRTYDTLNVLSQKGIVTASAEKPTTYIPIKPKELTKNFKTKMSKNIEYLDKHLPDIKEKMFSPIFTMTKKDDIRSKIIEMIASAKKEIFLLLWAKEFEGLKEELLNAYHRNVEIRIVSFEKINSNFGLIYEHPYAKQLEQHNEGRFLSIVCDEKEALYGKIHAVKEDLVVFNTKNKEIIHLIKESIIHEMMMLDIQANLPKELVYVYGAGLKRLYDKVRGPNSVYKMSK